MSSAALPFIECEQIHAGLAVSDIPTAVEFYLKKLGFQEAFTWGEPPTFAGVNLGEVQMFFGERRADSQFGYWRGLFPCRRRRPIVRIPPRQWCRNRSGN